MGVHPMKTEKSGLYSRENYLFDFSIDICFQSFFNFYGYDPSFVFIFLRKIMSTSNWPIARLDSIYWVFYWFTQIRTQLNMFVLVLILKTYISYLVYTMCI